MKALKLSTLALLAILGPGCALLNAVRSGNPNAIAGAAAAEAEKGVRLSREAIPYAEGQCKEIKTQQVGFEEERAIGGAVGVSLISKSGHLFLDGITEKDPAKLNQTLAQKKPVRLPDNAINDLTAYVSIVGKNLARFSARPDLPWTFAVIRNDAVNAFSAPGGYVVVTTALLKKVANEAQLAGVLGHEVAHVVHKHSLLKYRDGKYKQCVAANSAAYVIEHGGPRNPATEAAAAYAKKFEGKMDLDGADGKFIVFVMDAVITLLQSGNDRAAELETDKTALELITFAGYDTVEYEKFLASLGSQGGGVAASHPSTEDRVKALKALREGELKDFATGTAKPEVAKAFAPLTALK